MKNQIISILPILTGLLLIQQLYAQSEKTVVVKVNEPKADIQPTMWGIFFEDINFAADGGIYAELVKNRSFEFSNPLMGWKILKSDNAAGLQIHNRGESNAGNPRFAHINLEKGEGSIALINEGFRGMGVKQGVTYNFSVWLRQQEGSTLKLTIELLNAKDIVIGSANI